VLVLHLPCSFEYECDDQDENEVVAASPAL